MSERDGYEEGLCGDGAPDCIPPRASRGRRSGVILPGGGQDSDTILLDSVKAAPRRSSIIKLYGWSLHHQLCSALQNELESETKEENHDMEDGGFRVCETIEEGHLGVSEGTNHCESSCGGSKYKEARTEMEQKVDWK